MKMRHRQRNAELPLKPRIFQNKTKIYMIPTIHQLKYSSTQFINSNIPALAGLTLIKH